MLANSVGIIDSGYRGSIMGVFRYMMDENVDENGVLQDTYVLEKYERIVQLVHPSMFRIFVHLVNSPDELDKTDRGDGAFGSTGRI
jgi:dUTPase